MVSRLATKVALPFESRRTKEVLGFLKDKSARSILICLALDAFYEGGRMFIGATSAIYLLANGCTLAHLAYLKLFQGFVFLLAEVPTGAFADLHGRKKSLMLSSGLGIAGFLLFFGGHRFEVFALAEICTALSLCFWSGAYEAYCVDFAKLDRQKGLLDRFFHLNQALVSSSVLICGLAGSLLAGFSLASGYLAGVAAFIVCLALLFYLPEEIRPIASPSSLGQRAQKLLRSSWQAVVEGLRNQALLPLVVASIAVQFSIQPLLHYWQPFFEAIRPGLPTGDLGIVFVAYSGTSAVLGFAYARYTHLNFLRSPLGTIAIFAVFSGLYLWLAHVHTWALALILFAATQGMLALGRTSLMARINEQASAENRARVLSSVSLFSRFGMMGALFMLPALVHNQQMTAANTPSIYTTFAWISMLTVSLVFLNWLFAKSKSKAKG